MDFNKAGFTKDRERSFPSTEWKGNTRDYMHSLEYNYENEYCRILKFSLPEPWVSNGRKVLFYGEITTDEELETILKILKIVQ